ncbi:MAG TPA: 5-(carboxyamino)imidazole ribonucleotide synthase, partial [Usitatibacter sp.]|nr:5-(carboxyamino)imidazole ribonucleotide synthase [Usitatibacter sp.]
MVNLLGDIWRSGEPDWGAVLEHPGAHLHLYGKREARPGRKMGHVTVCEPTLERALEVALAIRRDLGIGDAVQAL